MSKQLILVLILILSLSACAGMKRSGSSFTAHAESLNLIGFRIPGDEYPRALEKVPAGAQVHTMTSNPSDLQSVVGVLNRIIGISYTEISGTTKQ
ncbi:MAG: hypothetical protein K1X83_03775 [Oligoflexia bacterium]|nr:hypothetical protein [Oligoflexia bacterium]